MAGIGNVAMGTNGGAVSLDALIQLQSALLAANVPMQNIGFAVNGKTYSAMLALKSSTGQYLLSPMGWNAWGNPAEQTVLGRPIAISNQLRSTLTKGTSSGIYSEALVGNWQELFIGAWGSLELTQGARRNS